MAPDGTVSTWVACGAEVATSRVLVGGKTVAVPVCEPPGCRLVAMLTIPMKATHARATLSNTKRSRPMEELGASGFADGTATVAAGDTGANGGDGNGEVAANWRDEALETV